MAVDSRTVSIEYTLTLDDGTIVDTNVDGEPLTYKQGTEQILPALEQELSSLGVNDTKEVTLSAKDGYGEINEEGYQSVPLTQIPEPARKVGASLVAQDPEGNKTQFRLHEISGEDAILDLNHPLAGKTLHFKVKILDVK